MMISHKVLAFALFICLLFGKVSAQNKYSDHVQIYLKEFSVYFKPDSCNGKMKLSLPNGSIMNLTLFECKGKMSFSVFDKKKRLIVEGFYINSLDTLKKYSIGKSIIDGTKSISVLSYFQPLANGIWSYYKEGKKNNSIRYLKGVAL